MVVGSMVQAIASLRAGKVQADAVQEGIGVTERNFARGLELIEPQIQAGDRAREAMMFELGLGPRPIFEPERDDPLSVVTIPAGPQFGAPIQPPGSGEWFTGEEQHLRPLTGFDVEKYAVGDQTFLTREAADNHLAKLLAERDGDQRIEYQGFRATPGYQFRLGEGNKAIERAAAARGMSTSGATMKNLLRYGQDYASNEYGNFYNRLAGLAGHGQTATGQGFAGYQQNANALSGLYGAQGNARASSYIGTANAVSQGINNAISAFASFGGMGGFGGF